MYTTNEWTYPICLLCFGLVNTAHTRAAAASVNNRRRIALKKPSTPTATPLPPVHETHLENIHTSPVSDFQH